MKANKSSPSIHAKSAAPPYTEWNDYLNNIVDQDATTIIKALWEQAVEIVKPKTLMAPSAAPLEDGHYIYILAWDNEEHHVEIEITNNGGLDWFYRNRKTDELAGSEDPIKEMNEGLMLALKLVAHD